MSDNLHRNSRTVATGASRPTVAVSKDVRTAVVAYTENDSIFSTTQQF